MAIVRRPRLFSLRPAPRYHFPIVDWMPSVRGALSVSRRLGAIAKFADRPICACWAGTLRSTPRLEPICCDQCPPLNVLYKEFMWLDLPHASVPRLYVYQC